MNEICIKGVEKINNKEEKCTHMVVLSLQPSFGNYWFTVKALTGIFKYL